MHATRHPTFTVGCHVHAVATVIKGFQEMRIGRAYVDTVAATVAVRICIRHAAPAGARLNLLRVVWTAVVTRSHAITVDVDIGNAGTLVKTIGRSIVIGVAGKLNHPAPANASDRL